MCSATCSVVSRPTMSTRKNGPIGPSLASATASSIFLIESFCSSCARHSSAALELRIRLTTKPGTSRHVIGCLRIAWAKYTAEPIVSVAVSSPSTISSSGRTLAGQKKWKPQTFSGRSVTSPISVIDSDDVFDARIAWPGVASSSSAKTACLISMRSGTASMTKSTSPKPSYDVVPVIRPTTSASCRSASSWVIFSLETSRASWPVVTSRAFSRPTSTNFWSTSLRTTGMPAAAITWAISPPMVPAPTTAALKTNMRVPQLLGGLEKGADPTRHRAGLRVAGVLRPRPEEPAQPVLAPPGDHVDVQVRDRLRDDVVDRVEDALRLHGVAHRDRDALRGDAQGSQQPVRRVPQRLDVLARDQQRVALEQRPVVEEGDEAVVRPHDMRRELAGGDAAEQAAHRACSAVSSMAKRRSVRTSESRMARRMKSASTTCQPGGRRLSR